MSNGKNFMAGPNRLGDPLPSLQNFLEGAIALLLQTIKLRLCKNKFIYLPALAMMSLVFIYSALEQIAVCKERQLPVTKLFPPMFFPTLVLVRALTYLCGCSIAQILLQCITII